MKNLFALAVAALLLSPLYSMAAETKADKYIFDPAHTQIIFSAMHMGMSHSHGRFQNIGGFFIFDEKNPEASTVEAVIDASRVDMGTAEWNQHVLADTLLNGAKFPQITFKSTKIEKTGEKTGRITGDFTLLGVTKPVTLNVTFNGTAHHPMNQNQMAGFSATGVIKRSDFGMTYGIPMVSDEINVQIEVEGIRQDFEQINK